MKLTWSDVFELDDTTPIDKAISKIDDFKDALKDLINTVKASNSELGDELQAVAEESIKLMKDAEKMNVTLEESSKALADAAEESDALVESTQALQKVQKENEALMAKLAKAVDDLNKAKERLKETQKGEAGSITDLKNKLQAAEAAYSNLGEATDASIKQDHLNKVTELSNAHKAAKKALDDAKKATVDAKDSYNELNKKVNDAKARLKAMAGGIHETSIEFKELQAFVRSNTKVLKDWDAKILDHRRNVGNYKDALSGLNTTIGKISPEVGNAINSGGEFINIIKSIGAAGLVAGFVIAALAVIVGSLTAYFKTTNEGADKFAIIMAKLNQILNNTIKIAAELGKELVEMFEEPEKALERYIDLMTLLPRFWIQLGKIALKAAKGDLGGAAILAGEGWAKIKKSIDGATEALLGNLDAAAGIAMIESYLDNKRRKQLVEGAEMELMYNKLILQSKDKLNFTDEQRLAFLRQAARIQEGQLATELTLAKETLATLMFKNRLATNDPIGPMLDEEAKQRAEIIKMESRFYQQRKANQTAEQTLIREIMLARRSAIERAIDGQREFDRVVAESNIKRNDKILADENATLEAQLDALRMNEAERQKILETERDKNLDAVRRAARDRIEAEGKKVTEAILDEDRGLQLQRLKIMAEYDQASRDLYDKLIKDIQNEYFTKLKQEYDNAFSEVNASVANEMTFLNEQYAKGTISLARYGKLRQDITVNGNRDMLKVQLQFLEEQLNMFEMDAQKRIDIEERIAQVKMEISQSTADELIEHQERLTENLNAIQQQAVDAAEALYMGQSESSVMRLEERLAREEEAKDESIRIAGDDKQAKEFIEQNFANKQKEIQRQIAQEKRKQAQFEKATAATRIIIETAKGISTAVGESPLTFGLPWSAFVAALGALQLAKVLSQPIPSYSIGTENHPGGPARIAEGNKRELVIHPDGSMEVAEREQIRDMKKGTKVVPNWKTESLMKDAIEYGDGYMGGLDYAQQAENAQNYSPQINIDVDAIVDAVYGAGQATQKAISKIPQPYYDERGFRVYERGENGRVLRLDNKYKF